MFMIRFYFIFPYQDQNFFFLTPFSIYTLILRYISLVTNNKYSIKLSISLWIFVCLPWSLPKNTMYELVLELPFMINRLFLPCYMTSPFYTISPFWRNRCHVIRSFRVRLERNSVKCLDIQQLSVIVTFFIIRISLRCKTDCPKVNRRKKVVPGPVKRKLKV